MSWAEFKARVAAKGLAMQFVESDAGGSYYCFAVDGGVVVYTCNLYSAGTAPEGYSGNAAADLNDFDMNFKPAANGPIVVAVNQI